MLKPESTYFYILKLTYQAKKMRIIFSKLPINHQCSFLKVIPNLSSRLDSVLTKSIRTDWVQGWLMQFSMYLLKHYYCGMVGESWSAMAKEAQHHKERLTLLYLDIVSRILEIVSRILEVMFGSGVVSFKFFS